MNFLNNAVVEEQLYPFTLTRAVADLRIGILTIREKWAAAGLAGMDLEVPMHLLPTANTIAALKAGFEVSHLQDATYLMHPWEIFGHNDQAIRDDVEWLTAGRVSQPLPPSNTISGTGTIFLEEGAVVEHCWLNAATGPIYIGKNAMVMEGSMLRGPVAVCEGVVIKMGTRIYGATTIGPYSVAGGEIKNSVIAGYSNKAHDGYLGDSVIGEWCNLGAGTSNSNLKNNAGSVKVWNQHTGQLTPAGMKCGLLMGDYTRSAINTAFNTGTVTGICCNVFGYGLTPKHIRSFSWGAEGSVRYTFDKAVQDIENWKKLKKQLLTEQEVQQLKHIFENY